MDGPGNTLAECEPRESPMAVRGGKKPLSPSFMLESMSYSELALHSICFVHVSVALRECICHSAPELNSPVPPYSCYNRNVFIHRSTAISTCIRRSSSENFAVQKEFFTKALVFDLPPLLAPHLPFLHKPLYLYERG